MSSHDIDRVRAYALGEMQTDERAAFEAQLVRDPELTALVEAWSMAMAFTAIEDAALPVSLLELDELDRRIDAEPVLVLRSGTPWLRVAAALLLIVGAGAAALGWGWGTRVVPQMVTLNSIPARVPAQPTELVADEQLALLANYTPVREGSIVWLDSIENGQSVARATGRPLLLWCIHPTCPFCKRMRESTLLDPEVQALVANFVPVQLDVMQERRYAGLNPMENGFPMFEVVNEDLVALHTFFNYQASPDFMRELQQGLEAYGEHVVLSWERLPEALEVLQSARLAEQRGRLGRALAGYQAMGELGAGLSLSVLAERGAQRLAARAHEFLDQARRNADPARVLSGAAGVFAGSSYAADFRALEVETRRTGDFPALTWSH